MADQPVSKVVTIIREALLAATRDAARAEADKAADSLKVLPPSAYREALLELCFRSVERSSIRPSSSKGVGAMT